ncbi:unnamed protein product [Chilo suppressalis]|uniref:Uncharacterized protein n=1 Tax=Chilo suppressalis TaxID=168631 RepID=A0ABN8EA27_CHISP|nr:unnamed protein product [Chilo suppressalis]
MNTYIALSCLLAFATVCHGYGGVALSYGLAPAAVSTANVVKAAPIPVIRTVAAPIISAPVISAPVIHAPVAPVIRTVAVASPVSISYGGLGTGYGGLGLGYGYGGLGYGYGGLGYGGYGAIGVGPVGYGPIGLGINKGLGLSLGKY